MIRQRPAIASFAPMVAAALMLAASPRFDKNSVVYVSVRLESVRVYPEGAPEAQQHTERVAVEPCVPLRVVKFDPHRPILKARDDDGRTHTFLGDWSARLHAIEKECRDDYAAHPAGIVNRDLSLRYELRQP